MEEGQFGEEGLGDDVRVRGAGEGLAGQSAVGGCGEACEVGG